MIDAREKRREWKFVSKAEAEHCRKAMKSAGVFGRVVLKKTLPRHKDTVHKMEKDSYSLFFTPRNFGELISFPWKRGRWEFDYRKPNGYRLFDEEKTT